MAFTQQTFLDASIRNFSANGGWGQQPSVLQVGLVEDPANGDSFSATAADIGSPVYFNYSDWLFGGLLQSYRKKYGQDGNPVYDVQVQDPRELLDGVQLILQDYTGSTYNVPNLYNVYGYLESKYGFGGSQSNETGVPWNLIKDAFYELQLTTPIRFRGHTFICNFLYGQTLLLPNYYRVPGPNISALGFITDICSTAGYDFFVRLEQQTILGVLRNVIKIGLISRRYQPSTGKIEQYITNVGNVTSKEYGFDLRNEPTTKFVTGGQVCDLYFQTYQDYNNDAEDTVNGGPPNFTDNTIWPYWGLDAYDNLIIGQGDFLGQTGTEHTFTLDGRPLYIQTGNPYVINYKSDIAEMRAARAGQQDWESYIWWKNDDSTSIHYRKADMLGLTAGCNAATIKKFLNECKVPGSTKTAVRHTGFAAMNEEQLTRGFSDEDVTITRNAKIYEFVKKYATEFYGRKFMVRIPFVLAKLESETDKIVLSVEPTDGGYIPEEYFTHAAIGGYMPYNVSKIELEDGRLSGYVKFVCSQDDLVDSKGDRVTIKTKFGLDGLSEDDYVLEQYPNMSLGNMRENLYVKCTLQKDLVFINSRTLFSPRVVIELPGAIPDLVTVSKTLTKAFFNDVVSFLTSEPDAVSTSRAEEIAKNCQSQFGSEHLWMARDALMQIPTMVALPLKSNILTYGPWYAIGAAGKVEYEHNESLTPWNYGGYAPMNLAGNAAVEEALTEQQYGESGSLEFPDIPTIQLMDKLIDGGPYVTDISVNVDAQGGATTNYRMSVWEHRFGKLSKYNSDRFLKMVKMNQEYRRKFRSLMKYPPPLEIPSSHYFRDTLHVPDPYKHTSSASILAGDILVNASGTADVTVLTNIAALAPYRLNSEVGAANYKNKAGVSLDGLFVPFSSNPACTNAYMPKFGTPTTGATTPTVTELNPFIGMESIVFPDGDDLPANLASELIGQTGHVKSIAFKAPMIVGGWGYDTDGNPVPSGTTSGTFATNYKKRADLWKIGPVDLRWDDNRKVWVTGGTTGDIKIGVLTSNLFPNGTAGVKVWTPNATSQAESTETIADARDWLLPSTAMLATGTRVIIEKVGGYWYVVGARRPC